MDRMPSRKPGGHARFIVTALALCSAYWVLQTVVEGLLAPARGYVFLPTEPDRLLLRGTVVVLLIVFGFNADRQTRLALAADRERLEIHMALMGATHHILNNLLNQAQLLLLTTEEGRPVDPATRDDVCASFEEAERLVIKLGQLDELSGAAIREAVLPQSQPVA
jgi:hypothetical protein